jgi:hypothetical protein
MNKFRRFSLGRGIRSVDFQYREPLLTAVDSARILTDDVETRNLVDPDVGFDFDKYSKFLLHHFS